VTPAAEHPHCETVFEQLTRRTDTTATRGAQIGPLDTVRSVVVERADDIESVDDIPSELARIDDRVTAILPEYDG
jgi:sn-glycerol 3-phosphate transport system substrate-binding protein